jgi:membrane protease YdiL (CAAX protease family)
MVLFKLPRRNRIKYYILNTLLKKIRESIALKWIVLYYTFFFLFGIYAVMQMIVTAVVMMLSNDAGRSIDLQGFLVQIDGVEHQIWNLPEFYVAIIISAIAVSILTLLVTRLMVMKNPVKYLGLKTIPSEQIKWFLISIVGLIVGIIFIEYTGIKPTALITAETYNKKVLLILGLVFFGPFIEELLFRGFLLKRMSSLLSQKMQWLAILITAILFAGLHLQYNLIAMAYILVVGIFLGIMKLKTDNLWFPLSFHILGNLYASLPFLF